MLKMPQSIIDEDKETVKMYIRKATEQLDLGNIHLSKDDLQNALYHLNILIRHTGQEIDKTEKTEEEDKLLSTMELEYVAGEPKNEV